MYLGSIDYKMVFLPTNAKDYIYYLHTKNYDKKILPLKVRIKTKIELTEIEVKNRTNLRDNFAKILKEMLDCR